MKVAARERTPGGFLVTVEYPNAYTNGESRFDRVFVDDAAVRGKSNSQVLQAVKDAIDSDPLGGVIGQGINNQPATKDLLEDRMVERYEKWQRWKNTHAEAVARSLGAAKVNAFKNRMDARWAAYLDALNDWIAAP